MKKNVVFVILGVTILSAGLLLKIFLLRADYKERERIFNNILASYYADYLHEDSGALLIDYFDDAPNLKLIIFERYGENLDHAPGIEIVRNVSDMSDEEPVIFELERRSNGRGEKGLFVLKKNGTVEWK